MKSHTLTGGEAYNFGQAADLYQRHAGAEKYERLSFESWGEDRIIIARDEMDSAVPLISSGLSKLPKVEGVVYRGTTMSAKKLKELYLSKQGQVVEHSFFTSASQSRGVAKGFTDYEGVPKSHKRIILDIQSKNGRDIGKISEFNGIFDGRNQREVLFDKGAKYYVSPEIEVKDGYYYIKLIEK